MITLYKIRLHVKRSVQANRTRKVKCMYVVPTVYNLHSLLVIRPAINYDVVRRYFEYQGYNVEYVQILQIQMIKLVKRSQGIKSDCSNCRKIYRCFS